MKIIDILAREKHNEWNIYLYEEENGHWYAYGHSAHLINFILKGMVTISPFTYHQLMYKGTVDRAEVDFAKLMECPITLCSDSEIIIECPPNLYLNN